MAEWDSTRSRDPAVPAFRSSSRVYEVYEPRDACDYLIESRHVTEDHAHHGPIWTCVPDPDPLDVSPTIQRVVSPAEIAVRLSPG